MREVAVVSEWKAKLLVYGGFITAPLLVVYDVVLPAYYLDNSWWVYVLLAALGVLLGFLFTLVSYEYYNENHRTYLVRGIPFPFTHDAEVVGIGLIANPLYFLLLVIAIYLTVQITAQLIGVMETVVIVTILLNIAVYFIKSIIKMH